jgi:hypothetical protein
LEPVVAWKEKSTGGTVYIIDGANRVSIAEQLKVRKVPLRWISAKDEGEAKLKCRILNLHRRHLTRDERRRYIEMMLRENPGRSDRSIAGDAGVSPTTVGTMRQEMEQDGEIEPQESRVGNDGKTYENEKSGVQIGHLSESGQAGANNAASDGPDIPEKLQQYFEHLKLFDEAIRGAARLANIFQQIEGTPAYLKGVEGRKHRANSTLIRTAGRALEELRPRMVCPECRGVEASLDNDPCPCTKCSDRGYLTAEEVAE